MKNVSEPTDITANVSEATRTVKEYALELGFDIVGITTADSFPDTEQVTLSRLESGLMNGLPWYTRNRVIRGCNPQEILPGANSIISVGVSYLNTPSVKHDDGIYGKLAQYSVGKDYHKVLGERLKALITGLKDKFGHNISAKAYVDTGPMLDRAVAQRAGIGWYGKNTNIISKSYGSWVFLGQVVTNLKLEPDSPMKKSCGNCSICIDQCPTGAIVAPYVIDNTKCISFLTIECRGSIPRHLRPLIGDWIFGCDICQDVCPVNRKTLPATEPLFQPGEHGFNALELLGLLKITEDEFQNRFRDSPIKRAKRSGLVRNACVALGNIGDPIAIDPLIEALAHDECVVRGHAAWALGQIGGSKSRLALAGTLTSEQDQSVREEIFTALDDITKNHY